MGGRLFDWFGAGVAASRPADIDMPALLVSPGSTAFYFATDTKILGVFDESGPSWFDIDAAALAAIMFSTLPDVDMTGLVDGDVVKWDAGATKFVPLTPAAIPTTEQIQDIVGAMISNGAGMNVTYDDALALLVFASTITQYTNEMAQDTLAAAFAAGTHTGLTITYDDATNKFDFAVTVTQYTNEMAMDAIAAMIAAGAHTGITIAYNDAGDAISFTCTITQYTNAMADARIALATLDDLDDVTYTSGPVDGDTLVWVTDHWEPGVAAGSGGADSLIKGSQEYLLPQYSSAVVSGVGVTAAVTGGAARSYAATNEITKRKRVNIATAATNNFGRVITSQSQVMGLGMGFRYVGRFAVFATVANSRITCGFPASTYAGTVDPSSIAANACFFVGKDSADTNLQVMYNDGAGAVNKIDLGASFPANTSQADAYEVTLYSEGGSSTINYEVKNLISGVSVSGSVGADVPPAGLIRQYGIYCATGATGGHSMEVFAQYYKLDYGVDW